MFYKNQILVIAALAAFSLTSGCKEPVQSREMLSDSASATRTEVIKTSSEDVSNKANVLDTAKYHVLMTHLVHGKPSEKWPAKAPLPLPGAILPFNRIVAYYGNFYSKGMGILGEYPPDVMLEKLLTEVKKWQAADSMIPVRPALHYIAVTAQRSPGKDGKYRLRMPHSQIDKTIELARSINAIVFLDIQVGHSCLADELPPLEKYLGMPDVHLGIDPEYSMKGGQIPCSIIGTFDASDVNVASEYLSKMVRKYQIPPKVLVVHRFTREMVTQYKNIVTRPEVQIVMHMDGFGYPAKKISSYRTAVANEPVQFAGFKLFYKNDVKTPGYNKLMTPQEVLGLTPSPVYIQYQ